MKKICLLSIFLASSFCLCNQYNELKELIKATDLNGTKNMLNNCVLQQEEKVTLLVFAQDVCNKRNQDIKWWQWRQKGLSRQYVWGHAALWYGILKTIDFLFVLQDKDKKYLIIDSILTLSSGVPGALLIFNWVQAIKGLAENKLKKLEQIYQDAIEIRALISDIQCPQI